MPLGRLGRMSWCLGPVSMIIPPAFVMHGRRVFDVHLFLSFSLLWASLNSFNEILALVFVFHSSFDVGRSMFDVHLFHLAVFLPYRL